MEVASTPGGQVCDPALCGTGALIDDRPDTEKMKDFYFLETVASVEPVNWVEKPETSWRKFPIFSQNGSGSCVAQTMAKLLGVMYWLLNGEYVHFSATHLYQRRSNKPSGGMIGVNAFDIARQGITLEELVPSQNMTDQQMDGTVIAQYKDDVGKIFAIKNYVQLPIQDIDTVASVIQKTGKAVMVWFYFRYDEWVDVPVINDPNMQSSSAPARHSISAVDYFLYAGKKALLIEDSWGPGHGIGGRRIITEDFFKKRNFFAAYPIAFSFDTTDPSPKPRYTFTKRLEFIPLDPVTKEIPDTLMGKHLTQKDDVIALQDILKYEGLFPQNISSTGYYGAVTSRAVLDYQRRYQVAAESELSALAGHAVGAKTIADLNARYGA